MADAAESDMVRHECAEALGSIAVDGIHDELKKFVTKHFTFPEILFLIFKFLIYRYVGDDEPAVLRESCIVALDMVDYANSEDFQYANSLSSTKT